MQYIRYICLNLQESYYHSMSITLDENFNKRNIRKTVFTNINNIIYRADCDQA